MRGRIFPPLIQSNGGDRSGTQKQSREVIALRTEKLLNLAVRRSAVTLEQFLSNGGGRSQD